MNGKELERVNLQPGFAGHDSMREYAKQMFGPVEMEGTKANIGQVGSFSSPSRTKMRLFKKGGHVESKEKKRMHLHEKQKHELRDVEKLINKEKKLKHGGDVVGGSLTNMHFPRHMGYEHTQKHLDHEKGHNMKRGGHMHKHKRHDFGTKNQDRPFHNGGHEMDVYKFRHGGHEKHHYSHGGNVYEREMQGEHESHRSPHNNYESMMRGEHCSHHAGSMYEDRPEHRHEVLAGLKHGGHAHHMNRHHMGHHSPRGKHHHYAAGGVAKVRHSQSTMSGHQISTGPSKMKVY